MILRSLLIVATPYLCLANCFGNCICIQHIVAAIVVDVVLSFTLEGWEWAVTTLIRYSDVWGLAWKLSACLYYIMFLLYYVFYAKQAFLDLFDAKGIRADPQVCHIHTHTHTHTHIHTHTHTHTQTHTHTHTHTR